MSVKTSEEARNEQVIRSLYSLAEGNSKNTSKFVSLFTDDGYFYDVGAGKKYFGPEIENSMLSTASATMSLWSYLSTEHTKATS